jgi:iron complex transport system ATP-binding protein
MFSARQRAKLISYVPQSSMLTFPYLVQEVVLMGRVAHFGLGASPGIADHREALTAMKSMDILHLAERPFQQLSGGEKQLVIIARALAQKASLMILDEPTASLDFFNQARALKLVRALARNGQTILMTTHAPDHALLVSDKVITMKAGKVFACGHPEETITEKSMWELYGIKTTVVKTEIISAGKLVKTCIPIIE